MTQAEPATAVSWTALNMCRCRLQSVIYQSDFNNDTIVTICDKNHLHVWHQDQEDSYFYCIVISELKSWLRYDNHFILHDQRRPHLAELRTLKGILYNIHDIVKSSLLYLKSISVTVGSCLGKVDLETVKTVPGTFPWNSNSQNDWLSPSGLISVHATKPWRRGAYPSWDSGGYLLIFVSLYLVAILSSDFDPPFWREIQVVIRLHFSELLFLECRPKLFSKLLRYHLRPSRTYVVLVPWKNPRARGQT